MYKKTIFKNGLRIITAPLKNTEAITILVLVGAGSEYETKEISGISHFLEHMLFKGTKKRSDTVKIVEPLDRIGGIYNAFTSKECTGYWAKVDSKHLDVALDWVSDIYLNSKFDEKEIEKEKGVIVEEINMDMDTPMDYVSELWQKLLYGDQPVGWPIVGEKKIITKLKRKDFLDYQKNHYSSKNTVICAAGNIEQESLLKKIKKYFKTINTVPLKPKLKVIDAAAPSALFPSEIDKIKKQEQPQSLIYFKKTDQTHFCLGARGYNLFHPQKYAQDILSVILGGMMSSRLWTLVREKKGLAYYIHTESENATDTGYLVTSAGVNTERAGDAIKIILKEYKKISQKKVPETELQKAKDNIKGKMALSLESSNSQASFCGMQELLEKKILLPKEIYAEIDKITSNDILKAAKDIFQSKNLNLALLGPHKNVKFSKTQLKL